MQDSSLDARFLLQVEPCDAIKYQFKPGGDDVKLHGRGILKTFLRIKYRMEQPRVKLLFPPGHFYSPIADPADMRKRESLIWAQGREMAGVDMNEQAQVRLLQELASHVHLIDYPVEKPGDQKTYYYGNDQFPVLDAEVLFCILVHFKPRRMIEVGSGYSSLISADVNRRLLGNMIDFTCIEPYPRQFLLDGVDGISGLIVDKAENVDLALFDNLGEGDILFIDSSHVSKVGSDVNFLFFEVIPRLKAGVMIHLHDIFLPDEYPKSWAIDDGRNWNEQYLLRAFLQFNDSFEILWASHYMATYYRNEVKLLFPRFPRLGQGASLWLRRCR